MVEEIFSEFRSIKSNSPKTQHGFISDDWIDIFLEERPTKEQFIEIVGGLNMNANLLWAIYNARI